MRAFELYEYNEYSGYGGWLSSDNKIYGIKDFGNHLDIIKDHGFGSEAQAMQAGWVRMVWSSNMWNMAGTGLAIKRAFRFIARRLFKEKAYSMDIDVMNIKDIPIATINVISKSFSLPKQKIELIRFIDGL